MSSEKKHPAIMIKKNNNHNKYVLVIGREPNSNEKKYGYDEISETPPSTFQDAAELFVEILFPGYSLIFINAYLKPMDATIKDKISERQKYKEKACEAHFNKILDVLDKNEKLDNIELLILSGVKERVGFKKEIISIIKKLINDKLKNIQIHDVSFFNSYHKNILKEMLDIKNGIKK